MAGMKKNTTWKNDRVGTANIADGGVSGTINVENSGPIASKLAPTAMGPVQSSP